MKIYFAEVPGGNQSLREKEIFLIGVRERLISYHYKEQGLITIERLLLERETKDKKAKSSS